MELSRQRDAGLEGLQRALKNNRLKVALARQSDSMCQVTDPTRRWLSRELKKRRVVRTRQGSAPG